MHHAVRASGTLENRCSALEKLANMLEFLGLTASEMTGAGTNMDVMANCTLPSVKLHKPTKKTKHPSAPSSPLSQRQMYTTKQSPGECKSRRKHRINHHQISVHEKQTDLESITCPLMSSRRRT